MTDLPPLNAEATPVRTAPALSPYLVMVLQGRILGQLLEDGLQELGLSVRKLGILGHLSASPGASLTEVARRAHITVASVHTIVASLTEAGVVVSGSGGGRGRVARLELTATGEELLLRARAMIAELDRDTFDEAPGAWPELGRALRAVTTERQAAAR